MRGIILFIAIIATIVSVAIAQQTRPSTCVTFAFDDTFQSGKEMSTYLDKYNWKSTFYLSPARLGCLHKDYLNWWDVYDLHRKGHEIGCHGFSHLKSFDLDYSGVKNQFCLCRAMLRRFGPPTSIAYPHGQVNETIKDIAKECGFCNGRGVQSTLELVKPRDIWNFNSYSIRREDTCEDLYFKLEDAINSEPNDANGRLKWLVLNNHVLCEKENDSCRNRYPYSILRSTYECLVRHVKTFHDQGLLCVKNVKEMLHTEPGQDTLPITRDMESIDLPSDFEFNPDLRPNPSSSGVMLTGSLFILTLIIIVVSVA